MRAREQRVERERGVVARELLLRRLQLFQYRASVGARSGVAGVEGDRGIEGSQNLPPRGPKVLQKDSPVVVRVCVLWVDGQCCIQARQCCIGIAACDRCRARGERRKCHASQVMRVRHAGIDGESGIVAGHYILRRDPKSRQYRSAEAMRLRPAGVHGERYVAASFRLLQRPLLQQYHGSVVVRIGVARVEVERGVETGEQFGRPTAIANDCARVLEPPLRVIGSVHSRHDEAQQTEESACT